jgi:hypothetical protein
MTWGPDVTLPFLFAAAVFLLLSAVALYFFRDLLGRAGESGWAWLPENAKFKTYEVQRRLGTVAAVVVGVAGIALLIVALL